MGCTISVGGDCVPVAAFNVLAIIVKLHNTATMDIDYHIKVIRLSVAAFLLFG